MNISVFENVLEKIPGGKYYLKSCINFPEEKGREEYGVCMYSRNGEIRRGGKGAFKKFEHLELLKYAGRKVKERNITSFFLLFVIG